MVYIVDVSMLRAARLGVRRVRRPDHPLLVGCFLNCDVFCRRNSYNKGDGIVMQVRYFHATIVSQDGKKRDEKGPATSKDLIKVAESGDKDTDKELAPSSQSKVFVFVRGAAMGTWNVIQHPLQT